MIIDIYLVYSWNKYLESLTRHLKVRLQNSCRSLEIAAAILEFFFGTNSLGQKANLISSLQMACFEALRGSRLFDDALRCSAHLWILVFTLKMETHENRQPQGLKLCGNRDGL